MTRYALHVTVAFVLVFAVSAVADDPYAGYIKMLRADASYSAHSWNQAGNWDSGGFAPGPGSNYYVQAGMALWHPSSTDTDFNLWKGGQLVLAGLFNDNVSASNNNGPVIPDLVLLDGAEIRLPSLGPFAPAINGITTTVTVASSATNPAKLTTHLVGAINTAGNLRSLELSAHFKGDADSAFTITRPDVNSSGATVEYGLYFWVRDYVFKQYRGLLSLEGKNTILKPSGGITCNWPETAVRTEGATLCLTNSAAFDNNTTNAYLRSLAANGGILYMGYKSSKLYPSINVTEGFSLDGNVEISAPVARDTLVAGITAAKPTGTISRFVHLASGATLDIASCHFSFDGLALPDNTITLRTDTNGDGSRDVYWTYADVVTMNTQNIETTGTSGTQYGAFEEGHASCWSNGETPTADSVRHYWSKQKLCFFYDTIMPNATLTISARNMTWKAGAQLTFKNFNIFGGNSWGSWMANNMSNVPKKRVMTAERFTVLPSTKDPSASEATIFAQGEVEITVDADMYGHGGLVLRNLQNQIGAVTLSGVNTNFHGRLTVTQVPKDATFTKFRFFTYLADARNWGGEYTASDDTWRAISITNFPRVIVTNDVAFTEPTRGMLIGGARFEVGTGKTMRLANQVTYNGELTKIGAGTLELAGSARFIDGAAATAPAAGINAIAVTAGALKISSAEAGDGLAVTFGEGTRLVVPADLETGWRNVKWDAPLVVNTASGKLPVEIEPAGDDAHGFTAAICTLSATAAASLPESTFAVQKMSNGLGPKSAVEKRTNGDGTVTYLVRMGTSGTQLILR